MKRRSVVFFVCALVAGACAAEAEAPSRRPATKPAAAPPVGVTAGGAAVPAAERPPSARRCLHNGDANLDGAVSAGDAQLVFTFAIGLVAPTDAQACAADCNGDRVVSAGDAQAIFYAALDPAFACRQNNGEVCSLDAHCASLHCANGHCCTAGECCAIAADCPPGYETPARCEVPATCQGHRSDAVCNDAICGSVEVDDDSGCGREVVALDCGALPDATCSGLADQDGENGPHCSGCTCDSDCDDGVFCNGVETCGPGGLCQSGAPPCEAAACLELAAACASPLPINAGASWRWVRGTCLPPPGWNEVALDDRDWYVGRSGFGYTDCSPNTTLSDMQNQYASVYVRRLFFVPDPAAVAGLELGVNYDDGFVAYLNGLEVARSNVLGNPPGPTTLASANHECGSFETFAIPAGPPLQAGVNVLALQGHNVTLASSDFYLAPTLAAVGAPPTPPPYELAAGRLYVDLNGDGTRELIDTVAELQQAAAASFTIFSDNKGQNEGFVAFERMLLWADSDPHHLLFIGNGDNLCGWGNYEIQSRAFIEQWLPSYPEFRAAYYPVIADGENEYFGAWQGDYCAGRPMLQHAGLLTFDSPPQIGRPEKVVAFRPLASTDRNTAYSPPAGEYGCDYHAIESYGGYRVHFLTAAFADTPSGQLDIQMPQTSRDWLMAQLNAIDKTDHDIVVVAAHSECRFDNLLTTAERNTLYAKADLILSASCHNYQVWTGWEVAGNNPIVFNTGQLSIGQNGLTRVHIVPGNADTPPVLVLRYVIASVDAEPWQNHTSGAPTYFKIVGGGRVAGAY